MNPWYQTQIKTISCRVDDSQLSKHLYPSLRFHLFRTWLAFPRWKWAYPFCLPSSLKPRTDLTGSSWPCLIMHSCTRVCAFPVNESSFPGRNPKKSALQLDGHLFITKDCSRQPSTIKEIETDFQKEGTISEHRKRPLNSRKSEKLVYIEIEL